MNLSNENRLLISCVRDGNFDQGPEAVSLLLTRQINWDEFVNTAFSQGIAPIVYKSLTNIPEKANVPEDIMDKLKMTYYSNVARNVYFYSELERILQVFNREGIEVMILKGAALAKTVYGDIGLRTMGDIDILVRPECLTRVKEIMSDMAYVGSGLSRAEEWYLENHFHLPPFIHKEKSIIIEIHWSVSRDSLGINVNRWWGRARKIRLGEASVLIPSPEDMVLHLCVSLYQDNYNKAALRGLCDIFHTIRCFSEEIDWKLFREVAGQSEIARPVYSLLFLVRKYFDGNNQAFPWLAPLHSDIKFTAIVERIIFKSENVSYVTFIRLLSTDSKWKRMKMIFADLFPAREIMSKRYEVQASSLKVYFYYAYRPFELILNYGRSLLKILCFRDSG